MTIDFHCIDYPWLKLWSRLLGDAQFRRAPDAIALTTVRLLLFVNAQPGEARGTFRTDDPEVMKDLVFYVANTNRRLLNRTFDWLEHEWINEKGEGFLRRIPGGYAIRSWHEHQVRSGEGKEAQRERKARSRATHKDDLSRVTSRVTKDANEESFAQTLGQTLEQTSEGNFRRKNDLTNRSSSEHIPEILVDGETNTEMSRVTRSRNGGIERIERIESREETLNSKQTTNSPDPLSDPLKPSVVSGQPLRDEPLRQAPKPAPKEKKVKKPFDRGSFSRGGSFRATPPSKGVVSREEPPTPQPPAPRAEPRAEPMPPRSTILPDGRMVTGDILDEVMVLLTQVARDEGTKIDPQRIAALIAEYPELDWPKRAQALRDEFDRRWQFYQQHHEWPQRHGTAVYPLCRDVVGDYAKYLRVARDRQFDLRETKPPAAQSARPATSLRAADSWLPEGWSSPVPAWDALVRTMEDRGGGRPPIIADLITMIPHEPQGGRMVIETDLIEPGQEAWFEKCVKHQLDNARITVNLDDTELVFVAPVAA